MGDLPFPGSRPPQMDLDEARAMADDFLGNRRAKGEKKPRAMSRSKIAAEEARARDFMKSGEWAEATATTFVALWSLLFERTYGVTAPLLPRERLFAARAAGRMLRADFADDRPEMAAFVRWAWQREGEREKWRRENKRDGGNIGWRLMFGPNLLTDFRIARSRRRGG